jgi:hypothetical protein
MESINDETLLYLFLVDFIIIKSIRTISGLGESLGIVKKQITRSGTNRGNYCSLREGLVLVGAWLSLC